MVISTVHLFNNLNQALFSFGCVVEIRYSVVLGL